MENIKIKYEDIAGLRKENGVYYFSKTYSEIYQRIIEFCHESIQDGEYSFNDFNNLFIQATNEYLQKQISSKSKQNLECGYAIDAIPKYNFVQVA